MKKGFLAVLFAAALALALAPSAQADVGKYLGGADFNFRGQYWMWGVTSDNVYDFDDATHDARRHVFQRFRWYFDTSYEGKYGGTIGLEFNWWWGSDQTQPGLATAPGGGPRGDDLVNGQLKHAYVWFMVPGTPAKLTLGLGAHKGLDPQNIMFASNDYFGIRLDTPLIKGILNMSMGWLWDSEGSNIGWGGIVNDRDTDDSDYGFIDFTANIAKWLTVATYHVWGHARNHGEITADDGSAFLMGLRGFMPLRIQDGDVFWHGLYFFLRDKGPLGPFYINGHVNYVHGSNGNPVDTRDPVGAWFGSAKVGVRHGPFDVGVQGWWFDGDKEKNDYQGWFGPDPFAANTELFYAGYDSWGTGLTGFEFAPGGTAFLGLEASWQATKKLGLFLRAGHLWWTGDWEKPDRIWATNRHDKEIGWEFNTKATYMIYPNLQLILGANYLVAGAGMDHIRQAAPFPIVGGDDAYELFWRLLYTF